MVRAPRSAYQEEEEEVNLVRVIAGGPSASSRECVISNLPAGNIAQSPEGVLELAASGPIGASAESEVGDVWPAPVSVLGVDRQLEVGETVRRTGRVTAGHHSNPHHLPRMSRVAGTMDSASNCVVAIFRPWN